MIAGIKKAKVLAIAVFCVLALTTAVLPYAALGYEPEVRGVEQWRGSGLALLYLYGKARNDANEPFLWMEVHATMYELTDYGTYLRKTSEKGGNNVAYLATTARYTIGYAGHGTFKTKSDHYWDYDGYSFGEDHKETPWQYH